MGLVPQRDDTSMILLKLVWHNFFLQPFLHVLVAETGQSAALII